MLTGRFETTRFARCAGLPRVADRLNRMPFPSAYFCVRPLYLTGERVEVAVDSLQSANRFISGFFFGALIAAVVMVLLCNAGEFSPFTAQLHGVGQVVVTVLIAVVIVDARPLAYKTVWRERRCVFILDEDLSATLRGRTVGIPAGVVAGILFQHYVMN